MKRTIYAASLLAILLFSSCGSNTSETKANAFASAYESNPETEVYITPHGKRYHHSWCSTIQGHSVRALSLEKAEKMRRTPCRVCYMN
jgi:hypothetical protein